MTVDFPNIILTIMALKKTDTPIRFIKRIPKQGKHHVRSLVTEREEFRNCWICSTILGLALMVSISSVSAEQIVIYRVEQMPNIPHPFQMKDWNALARSADRLLFDLEAQGEHLPLVWLDESRVNNDRTGFGLPTYVGDGRSGGSGHEAIAAMGAVLGATVAGLDKTAGSYNWVRMCEQYYNSKNSENLVLNYASTRSGNSFWYELWPHVLFYALADKYPGTGRLRRIVTDTAGAWYEACLAMGGGTDPWTVPDFNHTSFDFKTMKPADNADWKEPDAAAGIAWLEYMAWTVTGNRSFLDAADWGMQFLEGRTANPYYEVLLPFGAGLAARMNAELGRSYDVEKLVNWCFDGDSVCRPGWGVITGRWGGYDISGLMGSLHDHGGYGFAMNTFSTAAALVPLVRYDDRFARAIGKWMLNAANAARLFYPDTLPSSHQSCPDWTGDPSHLLSYEGVMKEWNGKRPFATGDAVRENWGPKTDFAVYGTAYAGFFGGIIATTEDEKILRLDCLATDFFGDTAYPTYLYFNPYTTGREISIDVGPEPRNLYDTVANRLLKEQVTGEISFTLAGDLEYRGRLRLVKGVVVDYLTPVRYTPPIDAASPYGHLPVTRWDEGLLGRLDTWTVPMNEPLVSAAESGLRLQTGSDKDWAVISVPNVVLPPEASAIRITVSDISPGTCWSVKLTSDLDGDGKPAEDWLPCSSNSAETVSRRLHSVIRNNIRTPLTLLQLAVEGPAGSYATFEQIEFIP